MIFATLARSNLKIFGDSFFKSFAETSVVMTSTTSGSLEISALNQPEPAPIYNTRPRISSAQCLVRNGMNLGKSSFTHRNQSTSLLKLFPACDFSARSIMVAGNSIFFSM